MKSPHQWQAKASIKPVTLAAGAKLMQPMSTSRATPNKKTVATIYSGYGGKK